MSFSALEADASSTIVQDQDDALTQWVLEGSQLRADFHESISQRPDLKMRLYEICEQMHTHTRPGRNATGWHGRRRLAVGAPP